MGTGGALFKLKSKVKDFILVNGDTIFDIDLINFFKSISKQKIGSLALTSMDKNTNNYKLNNLSINSGTLIYKRKSMLMNGGVYFFREKIFRYLKNEPLSLEDDLLPKFIQNKKLTAKKYKNFFLDIRHTKYIRSAHKKLKKYFYKPAVFLDRDGVINYDSGYVYKKKDFKFRKGVLKGLKYLIKKNYYIFLITNQAGIAKGYYKESDFKKTSYLS